MTRRWSLFQPGPNSTSTATTDPVSARIRTVLFRGGTYFCWARDKVSAAAEHVLAGLNTMVLVFAGLEPAMAGLKAAAVAAVVVAAEEPALACFMRAGLEAAEPPQRLTMLKVANDEEAALLILLLHCRSTNSAFANFFLLI